MASTIAAVRSLRTSNFAKLVIICKFFKITKFGNKVFFSVIKNKSLTNLFIWPQQK